MSATTQPKTPVPMRGLRGLRGLLVASTAAACLWLASCASPGTRVILLPQADGRPSAVVVSTASGSGTLSQPYERATAAQGAQGAPRLDKVDPAQVLRDNKPLFDLMPPAAQHYTVYFEPGGTQLTASSQIAMNDALQSAQARSGGEIVVTGHTDTTGTGPNNDGLSLKRAEQVRQLFLARGFPPERVIAVGRGERDLAVPTANQVDEPRNRRVVIEVR